MQNTTPNIPALESIDSAALLFVSGGCHKRHCGGCCQQQQTVINNQAPAQQPPSVLPQAAPQAQPAPMDPSQAAMPSGPSGDSVSTSVVINGQPVG